MTYFNFRLLVTVLMFACASGPPGVHYSYGGVRTIPHDNKSCEKSYVPGDIDTIPKQILMETYNDSTIAAGKDSIRIVIRNVIENRLVHSKNLKPKIL